MRRARREGRPSLRRRIAVASWRPSRDGRIHTRMAVDAGPLLAYVAAAREGGAPGVTVTHVVGAALARAIAAAPEIRARVVLGRIVPFSSTDIAFAVDIGAGRDLAPVKVVAADTLSPAQIAARVGPQVADLRGGRAAGHNRSLRWARPWPMLLLRPGLAVVGFWLGAVGRPAFGQAGSPLGSAFVSNVGPLGLTEAYLAPLPFARCPLYVAVGAVHDAVQAVQGRPTVVREIVLTATADHRLVDGAHAGRIVTVLRELLAEPGRLDRNGG